METGGMKISEKIRNALVRSGMPNEDLMDIFNDTTKCGYINNFVDLIVQENAEKVIVYERLLHQIQLHANVTMNANAVHQLIGNICNWSYAHRVGNGEVSDEEQNERVKRAFDNLLDVKHDI